MSRRIPAAAVILAGGRSKRMGRPKHALRIGKACVLDLLAERLRRVFPRVYVSVGLRPIRLPAGARAVRDLAPGQGPLAGLHAAFAGTREKRIFLVACDMPLVSEALIRLLWKRARGKSGAVPAGPRGVEPLCGFYARALAPEIRRKLERGERSVYSLARVPGMVRVPWSVVRKADPHDRSFLPMNTPREWRRVRGLLLRDSR